jgi:uncharacterized YigZ family protein
MPSFLTLAAPAHVEPEPIKGSRFIGDASAVESEQEAQAFVTTIKKEHPNANHHCFAWRLQAGDQGFRTQDAGEPGGTAGKPILARIDGQNLRGVVVVVTRYFGGKKLGKGGLIRAYGGTAGKTLEQASLLEVRETRRVTLQFGYSDQGAITSTLRHFDLSPSSESFKERVTFTAQVPVEEVVSLNEQVQDRTAGRVVPAWDAPSSG